MSGSVLGRTPEEFEASVKAEQARLREALAIEKWKLWGLHHICPVCGALVVTEAVPVHAEWHARCCQ